MPHPKGTIAVNYDNTGNSLKAEIILPEGTEGTFLWKDKTHELKSGKNKLSL